MNNSLNLKVVGLTLGILWALSVLTLGVTATFFNYGTPWVTLLGSVYIGYTPTIVGTLVGTCWGFFDGLIGGIIFAWLYNRVLVTLS